MREKGGIKNFCLFQGNAPVLLLCWVSIFGSLQNWTIQAYTIAEILSTCFGYHKISCTEAVSVDVSQYESYVTTRFRWDLSMHLCTQSTVLFLVIFLCLRYPDVPFFSLPPLRSYPFLVCHTQCCWHHLRDCWWPISSNHNILKSFNCGILHLKHLTKCCFSEKWEIKVLSSMVSCHAFALCAP